MRRFIPIYFTPPNSLLTFLNETSKGKAIYKCSCGKKHEASINNVKMGKTKSCGCQLYKGVPKHGLSNHPLYSVYENMISRCYNKKTACYKRYGGRGVIICKEWKGKPEVFIKWAIKNGWKPGLELDKDIIGNGLVYGPNTCKFVTSKENSRNRRDSRLIQYCGKKRTLAEWAEMIGIRPGALSYRIKNWSLKKSLTTPKSR